MLKLLLFAIILQVTNVSAEKCPDTEPAKFFCRSIVCTDEPSNGEIPFRICMNCYPSFLRGQCAEKIAEHYALHMVAEKSNQLHVQKFVESAEEIEPMHGEEVTGEKGEEITTAYNWITL